MTRVANGKVYWPEWLTLIVLLAAVGIAISSCSNRADFVCEVLDDCKLLEGSVDRCIESIGLAYDSMRLDEGEVGHCLDCVVEHPCHEITTICRKESCGDVLEVIEAGRGDRGGGAGEAGAPGQGGAP